MITVLVNDRYGVPTFAQVSVKLNQGLNKIQVEYLQPPEPMYDTVEGTDELEFVGYDEGEAVLTVHIKDDKVPAPIEFGTMIRDFYLDTGFMWTSRFEQDILSEVYGVVEI